MSRSGGRYKAPAAAESRDQGVKEWRRAALEWRLRGVPTPVSSRMSRPRLAPQTCASSCLSTWRVRADGRGAVARFRTGV